MKIRVISFFSVVLLFFSFRLWAEDPIWHKVLSGEVAFPPAVASSRVFVVTNDRSITCLSERGSFLWSRPLPGKTAPFLFASPSGIVIAGSEPGILSAYNLDGNFLWQLRGNDMPLFKPSEGRDGRIFLAYRNRIVCISGTGSVKWTLPVSGTPVSFGAESGDGDLLIPCADKTIARVSPYGELLERIAVDDEPCAIQSVPNGFVAGFRNGMTRSFDVRSGRQAKGRPDSEPVWEYRGQTSVAALSYGHSNILVLDSGGLLTALNGTDGSFLWSLSAGMPAAQNSTILFDYDQFTVSCIKGLWAANSTGQQLWLRNLPEGQYAPTLSENGTAYTTTQDWVISAWQIEAHIKNEKKTPKGANYGILNGKSLEYGLPSSLVEETTGSFLASVSQDISDGIVGTREVNYARRLAEILRDSINNTDDERAKAATLLGKLGSTEYRSVLESEAYRSYGTTLSMGILFGLSACVPDPDGTALAAIRTIVRNCGSRDETVGFAACDALYAIIRYSTGTTAREGTVLLAQFLNDDTSIAVNDHAREMMERLLK